MCVTLITIVLLLDPQRLHKLGHVQTVAQHTHTRARAHVLWVLSGVFMGTTDIVLFIGNKLYILTLNLYPWQTTFWFLHFHRKKKKRKKKWYDLWAVVHMGPTNVSTRILH